MIKVKSRPELASLYPSERRYSASTVRGLSLVHLALGLLLLFLSACASSAQGFALAVTCVVPAAFGVVAWRRWYVDRNIAIFFYASLFSVLVSALCATISALELLELAKGRVYREGSAVCNVSGVREVMDEDGVVPFEEGSTVAFEEFRPADEGDAE